ncbi:MAG: helix-turn-helix domain-containing protein [Clostridia bacterium]|nr:helix-turn-helix domain-containing protein [Clostridia bacterium]
MIDLGHPSYAHKFDLSLKGFGKTEIHNHARLDIIYMLSGSAGIKTVYRAYKLDATDFCALNVMELYQITFSENAQALCFSISANLLSKPIRRVDFCSNDARVTPEEAARLRTCLARAFQLYYKDAEDNRFGIYSCVYGIVDLLYRYYYSEDLPEAAGQDKFRMLEQMLTYIQENASQNLQLSDLANKFYLSVGHVSRIFQHSLHTTFTNYLREVRLNNAYDLLLNTDQSVTEIAVNCGFGSTNRMIEVFSQKFGETPGKFRRHSQEREMLPLLKEQTQIFDDLLKYAAEAPKPVPPSRPVAREGIDIPNPRRGRTREMGFFKLINVGWAKELLYEPVQQQLRQCQEKIGFEFIRFHGIFDEDMMVYQEDAAGKPVYNFTYLDLVYDFILSLGLKPYVEFSYYPKALAADSRVEMRHNSYIYGLPRSMEKWCALVRATTQHWIARYGLEAVRGWRFRTGEGISLYYRRVDFKDFLTLFRETYRAVKSVDYGLCFGGMNLDMSMLSLKGDLSMEAFMQSMVEMGSIPDFYSFQCFHTDYNTDYRSMMRAVVSHGSEPAALSEDENYLSNNIRALRRIIRQYDEYSRPIILDTWNASIWQRDLRSDTCFKSAFIFKNMLENVDVLAAFGYWNLSDMFEEVYASSRLFHGGYGLMTYNGIPKASFNAFVLLKRLGSQLVQRGEGWFVTCSPNGDVQIALYNYCHYDTLGRQYLFVEGSEDNPYEMFKKSRPRQFDIRLGLPDGMYSVERLEITRRGCWGSPYDLWVNMGAPDSITAEQVEYLKSRSLPHYTIRRVEAKDGLMLSEILEPHGVCVIVIKSVSI